MAPVGVKEEPLAGEGQEEKSLQDQTLRTYPLHPGRRLQIQGTGLEADEIVCRLCGKEDETQEHVMWNCYGSVSIKEARERMSSRIREVLVHHGLNDEAVAAAICRGG